jgi:amino acid transporter
LGARNFAAMRQDPETAGLMGERVLRVGTAALSNLRIASPMRDCNRCTGGRFFVLVFLRAGNGTPAVAVVLSGALCLLGILVWAPFVGAADYYGDLATIGTLALILVYVGVTGAELAEITMRPPPSLDCW